MIKKLIFTSLVIATSSSFAQAVQDGYLTDSSGHPVKSGFGLCWKASSDLKFSPECGDIKVAQVDKYVPTSPPARVDTPEMIEPAQEITPIEITVLFKFDSSVLSVESQEKLSQLIKQSNKSYHLKIVGHTDSIGTDDYNDNLGLRRAQEVKNYLIKNGFNEQNMEVISKGEKELVVNCKSIACQSPNRRVIISNE